MDAPLFFTSKTRSEAVRVCSEGFGEIQEQGEPKRPPWSSWTRGPVVSVPLVEKKGQK
jgi:hypothetical protein